MSRLKLPDRLLFEFVPLLCSEERAWRIRTRFPIPLSTMASFIHSSAIHYPTSTLLSIFRPPHIVVHIHQHRWDQSSTKRVQVPCSIRMHLEIRYLGYKNQGGSTTGTQPKRAKRGGSPDPRRLVNELCLLKNAALVPGTHWR